MTDATTVPSLSARLIKMTVPPQSVIAEAEARARAVLAAAEADATQIRERAMVEARAAVERAVAERLVATRAALMADMAATRQQLADILAVALAKLVGLTAGPDALTRAVDVALGRLGETAALSLTLHPDRQPEIVPLAEAFRHRTGCQTRIETDPGLGPDRVRIETAGQRIEIDLAEQIRMFRELVAG